MPTATCRQALRCGLFLPCLAFGFLAQTPSKWVLVTSRWRSGSCLDFAEHRGEIQRLPGLPGDELRAEFHDLWRLNFGEQQAVPRWRGSPSAFRQASTSHVDFSPKKRPTQAVNKQILLGFKKLGLPLSECARLCRGWGKAASTPADCPEIRLPSAARLGNLPRTKAAWRNW